MGLVPLAIRRCVTKVLGGVFPCGDAAAFAFAVQAETLSGVLAARNPMLSWSEVRKQV